MVFCDTAPGQPGTARNSGEEPIVVELEIVAEGLRFPEGPVVMDDGAVLVVEIEAGNLTRVDPADGTTEVVANLGGGPNGAAVGPDGRIYVCNNGGFEWSHRRGYTVPGHQARDYRGGSIQAVDLNTGEVETVASEVGGRGLKGPNDLVFDRFGGMWFTDHGKTRPRDRDQGGLYYGRPLEGTWSEVVHPLDAPNGVGLSPDGSVVHVAETHTCRLLSWTLASAGVPAPDNPPGGRFVARPAGRKLFDSLAVEEGGNIAVATIGTSGISVFAPTGEEVDFVSTDDPLTTNIAFGGEDMRTAYITLSGTGRLARCRWPRPGLRLEF